MISYSLPISSLSISHLLSYHSIYFSLDPMQCPVGLQCGPWQLCTHIWVQHFHCSAPADFPHSCCVRWTWAEPWHQDSGQLHNGCSLLLPPLCPHSQALIGNMSSFVSSPLAQCCFLVIPALMYHSLAKERPGGGQPYMSVKQGEWVLFWVFSHLTMDALSWVCGTMQEGQLGRTVVVCAPIV